VEIHELNNAVTGGNPHEIDAGGIGIECSITAFDNTSYRATFKEIQDNIEHFAYIQFSFIQGGCVL
jgi:hypothetical protein